MESYRRRHRMTASTRHAQAGMTVLGFLILAVLVGVVGLAALKVTPMYIKNMRMTPILNDVEQRAQRPGRRLRQASATSSRERFSVEDIQPADIDALKITQSKNGYIVASDVRGTRVRTSPTSICSSLSTNRSRSSGDRSRPLGRGAAQVRLQRPVASRPRADASQRGQSQQRAPRVSRRLVPELRDCAPALRASARRHAKAI